MSDTPAVPPRPTALAGRLAPVAPAPARSAPATPPPAAGEPCGCFESPAAARVLESLPVPVWVVGAPDGRLLSANRRASELLVPDPVFPERDRYLAGLSVLDEQSRPVHRRQLPLYRAIHEGVELRDWEATVMRPDGTLAGVLWNTSVLRGPDGRVAAAVAVLQDIDERRRREGRLKRGLERAEQAVRRQSRFFGAVCHDLRSRLNNITLLVQTLAGRSSLAADPEAARDAAEMAAVARNMAEALDELVGNGRPARRPSVRTESFLLGELFDELSGSAGPAARSRGLAFAVDCPEAPVRLRADRNRLRLLLALLLDNAIRHTVRGKVTLAARVPAAAGGEPLRLTVADTGPGIPPEFQKTLLDDPVPTREFPTAGVGLPMCRRWAELLGGRLGLQSVPGSGTSFSVVLPGDVVQPIGEISPETPPLVLLVEDDPMTRRALARLLRGFGYRTLEAGDGRAGVEMAAREQPALVLMDLMMPELDGMDAIRAMRDDPRTRGIPAVILTGDVNEDRRRQADELRVEGWLDKPVDVPRLRELIEGLLR